MAGRPRAPVTLVPPAAVMNRAAIAAEVLSFVDVLPLITDTDSCITFLAQRRLIRNTYDCAICNVPCGRVVRRGVDGCEWRCRQCRRRKSLRDGSFFSGSHLTLKQLIILIHLWCDDQPQTYMKIQTGIDSDDTMVDWCNFLRDICVRHMGLVGQNWPGLGGLDNAGNPITVEIDETYFFHRKYHRGRIRRGKWVFGAVERGTGRCVMRCVHRRNRQTLERLIRRWLLPGTHIVSDAWPAYNHLDQINGGVYTHDVVVHQQNFVDPRYPWIHTQTIEGLWKLSKKKLRRQHGTSRTLFNSYLYEFMWRRNTGDNKFGEMVNCIGHFYPV